MVHAEPKKPPKDRTVFPVLLAGGSGTRLWPVSRTRAPKQLAAFGSRLSLLQETIQRLSPALNPDNVLIVCGEDHRLDSDEHLTALGIAPRDKILVEPVGRNTAPAILLAVLKILARTRLDDAIFFVFPADHVVRDVRQFHHRIAQAVQLAGKGNLVTFGIRPEFPETGYGYIEGGEPVGESGFRIKRFVEKPDRQTARAYVEAGNFYWNSGMFAFNAAAILKEYRVHQPKMVAQMEAIVDMGDPIPLELYERLDNLAFDVAIMENTRHGVVLPSAFGWSDIGSWKSLQAYLPKDEHGNALVGDVLCRNMHNSLLLSSNRLVAANDLSDIVVVETPDAVLVSNLETSRDVKEIVAHLKKQKRPEHRAHLLEKQTWGSIETLKQSAQETVLRVTIKPGKTYACDLAPSGRVFASILAGDCRLGRGPTAKPVGAGDAVSMKRRAAGPIENIGDREAVLIIVHQTENRIP